MARSETATRSKTGNDATHDPAKDLDAEIAALREDVATITATLGDIVKHRGGELRSEAKKATDRARDKGEHALESVHDSYEHTEDEVKTMIRDKPITSVLVAAGVGYVLSKILRI